MDRAERAACLFPLLSRKIYIITLPSDNLVNYFLLLHAASSQINTCCLYAFMSHEIGKQGYVIEFLGGVI